MVILNFQKPNKVLMNSSDDFSAQVEFKPLEPGYGLTIGNAIRRVLLSSLEGYAITSINIEGVHHEFSTISGLVEDVTEIILNLKQVRFKQKVKGIDNETVSVVVVDKQQLTARDIGSFMTGFEVLNPNLVICNMNSSVKLKFNITINKGRGFVNSEENRLPISAPKGTIVMDSIFTPIKNVKYKIENYRVEQKTDYEKLIIDVDTDGSISVKDALTEAAKILIHHFMLFSDEKITLESEDVSAMETYNEEVLHMRQLLQSKLTDLDLSVRALNCLKIAEIDTLGELIAYNKEDLMKFRNFGRKSLIELENLVEEKKLSFGMDISKYE